MANSSKKPRTHNAERHGIGHDVSETRATRSALAKSSILTMSLRGLVGLTALLCSLYMVTPRNRSVPFSEPRSDAVDHVNP